MRCVLSAIKVSINNAQYQKKSVDWVLSSQQGAVQGYSPCSFHNQL